MRSWNPAQLLSILGRRDADDPTDPDAAPGTTADADDGVDASPADGATGPSLAEATESVLEASRLMTEVLDRAMIRAIAVSTAIEVLGGKDGAFVRGRGLTARWMPDVPDWAPSPRPADEPTVRHALEAARTTTRTGNLPDGQPCGLAAAPVLVEGTVVGALVVLCHGTEGFPTDVERRLGLLTSSVGTALGAADALLGATTAAEVDDLTGLRNRRRMHADLALLRPDEPVAFAMLDIDNFKHFNDTNGHTAGDAALRAVAAALAGSVRPADVAYRYGGEELSVLLRGCDAAAAAVVMDRVHTAIRAVDVPGAAAQPTGRITVSIGVAAMVDGDTGTLQERADAALYEAKAAGRDRTVTASGPDRT